MKLDTPRNRVAWALANLALKTATPTYRAYILGSIQYGIRSSARDQQEGRTPPPPLSIRG